MSKQELPEAWEYFSKQAGIDVSKLPEIREKLREQKSDWEVKKLNIAMQIRELEKQIASLDEQKTSPPGIKGARYIHDGSMDRSWRGQCGFRAVIFSGTTPQGGLAGGDDTYYCLFCERYLD